eukprot:scaffold269_cov404-Prasinococcus_capsulatus_cf.AAC.38
MSAQARPVSRGEAEPTSATAWPSAPNPIGGSRATGLGLERGRRALGRRPATLLGWARGCTEGDGLLQGPLPAIETSPWESAKTHTVFRHVGRRRALSAPEAGRELTYNVHYTPRPAAIGIMMPIIWKLFPAPRSPLLQAGVTCAFRARTPHHRLCGGRSVRQEHARTAAGSCRCGTKGQHGHKKQL